MEITEGEAKTGGWALIKIGISQNLEQLCVCSYCP